MPRSSLVLFLALAVFACDDEPTSSTVDAVDTSGLDGLPDVAQPDVEPTDTAPDTEPADVPAPSDVADVPAPSDVEDDVPAPSDVEPDVPAPSDVEDDVSAPSDVADATPDTSDTAQPADTTPDTSPDPCVDCLEVGVGPLGVTIVNEAIAEAPTLEGLVNGSNAMSGAFELKAINVYTKGAFDGFLISGATVANAGETSGTVSFEDDRWAFFLDLDLIFNAQTVLGPNSGASRNAIQGGGCFTLADHYLRGDTSTCASGWPSGATPPDEVEFSYDANSGRFLLKVVLSREFVLSLIPPDYALIANSAIVGPIRFIAVFAPAR